MRARITWIGIVVGLLLMSAAIQGVLVVMATTDPSFAVEPNYDVKAAHWNEHQRQELENARLGWTLALAATPAPVPGAEDVTVTVTDRAGRPLAGAAIAVETFHNARASHVLRARLGATGDEGVYTARLPMERSGIWEFRFTVTRGPDLFTRTERASVLCAPRGPRGAP